MGRLFWKILLIVLVSNAIVFLATIVVSSLLHTEHPALKIQLEDTYKLGRKAVQIYEREGLHELRRFLRRANDRGEKSLFLLDAEQKSLTRPLPPELIRQIVDYPTIISPRENKAGFRSLYAIAVSGREGKSYHFVASYRPGYKSRFNKEPYQDFRLLLLLSGIVISSALIAWLFSRPMSVMKSATRMFAEGKHDTRIPPVISKRRDAIGELALEFNIMAEQVDGLLSSHKRLLRDVSHELRSPLARMQVALSLIEQRSGDTPLSKEHERLQLEMDRLNVLIGQILTLTRLDSGSQLLDRQRTDLVALLDGLIQDACYEHSHDKRTMVYKGPDQLWLNVDPARLESAIENVMRNAMKYTRDNTEVQVTLSESEAKVLLSVRDHGPGVPQESLSRIFDAFYRTQDAREEKSGGVGVGLAISRRIIELHGGQIQAENVTGGGLQVTITMPLTPQ